MRWALRTTLMFFGGVIPASLLLISLLGTMPLVGISEQLTTWFAVQAGVALLGIIGLSAATFRDDEQRILPNAVTIALVVCGLLADLPYLLIITAHAITEGGSYWFLQLCLLGPAVCAVYFLVEQFHCARHRRSARPACSHDP